MSKLRDGAIKHRKVASCCSPALDWTASGLNCQTSSFLDFPFKIYSVALVFCKTYLTKGRRNCRGVSLLWIVHRKSSQEQNNKRRLQVSLGVIELLNLQFICFPTRYGTIYVDLHSWFCRNCFDRAKRRRVRLFLQLISLSSDGPDAWTRREFYICELDIFRPGSIYFCLTSLILLKQLFLSPSWAMSQ